MKETKRKKKEERRVERKKKEKKRKGWRNNIKKKPLKNLPFATMEFHLPQPFWPFLR
jgi:hypothetical protein